MIEIGKGEIQEAVDSLFAWFRVAIGDLREEKAQHIAAGGSSESYVREKQAQFDESFRQLLGSAGLDKATTQAGVKRLLPLPPAVSDDPEAQFRHATIFGMVVGIHAFQLAAERGDDDA